MDAGTSATPSPAADRSEVRPPLYWRLLRLRTLRPNGWQRAMLVEGVLTVAVILVLADVASAWTLLVLPLASVVLVKGHDLLATALRSPGPGSRGPALPAGPTTDGEDANGATRTG